MKLCQVIAVEKGVKSRANESLTELHKLTQKPATFNGFTKTYTPKEEGGEVFPPETLKVGARSQDVLRQVSSTLTELFDITAQKDYANMGASADVVVEGNTLVADAPVPFLLFLEKQLENINTFVTKLPTLDESEDWRKEEASGLYKTQAIQRNKTAKVQRPIVLYDATDKHPAQTQLITEDQTIGSWSEVKSSGAITRDEKEKILTRVQRLLDAVKSAREEANSADAPENRVGDAIFSYIFA